VRLEPGQKFSTTYTVSVGLKVDGLRESDTKHRVRGYTYEIMPRKRRWRWMFEDGMAGNMGDERREILRKKEV